MANATWKILGTDDSQTVCEVCGKKNLKKVVYLENVETLEQKAVGCDCAGRLVFGKKTSTNTAIVKDQANIVRLAQKWLAKGYTPEQVREAVGARGWPVDCRRGILRIGSFAEINIEERG